MRKNFWMLVLVCVFTQWPAYFAFALPLAPIFSCQGGLGHYYPAVSIPFPDSLKHWANDGNPTVIFAAELGIKIARIGFSYKPDLSASCFTQTLGQGFDNNRACFNFNLLPSKSKTQVIPCGGYAWFNESIRLNPRINSNYKGNDQIWEASRSYHSKFYGLTLSRDVWRIKVQWNYTYYFKSPQMIDSEIQCNWRFFPNYFDSSFTPQAFKKNDG